MSVRGKRGENDDRYLIFASGANRAVCYYIYLTTFTLFAVLTFAF